ncbi:MAG: hypothetical protein JWO17_1173 [Actinomycetia bacterium]|nr:hypothetical protein [Actinomycetes bacterium]
MIDASADQGILGVQLLVDGNPHGPFDTMLTSSPVTVDVGPPYPTIALTAPVPGSSVHLTFQWSTTALAAGSHTLTVGVSDPRALTATSPPVHLAVDNAPPVAVMYGPSGAVKSWLHGFLASTFPVVFRQTNPAAHALVSGTVAALNGGHRRYRFEVHTDTTIVQFAPALSDTAFARP